MRIKVPDNYYRWQPELALSTIYWSITFIFFFLVVISFYEVMKINLISGVFLVFFLIGFYFGNQRYFILEKKGLIIQPIRHRYQEVVSISKIKKVAMGSHGLTITYHMKNETKTATVLMRKKTLIQFITALEQTKDFQAVIEGELPTIK